MSEVSTAQPAFIDMPDPDRRVGPPPCRWDQLLLVREWSPCRNPASLRQGQLVLCEMHARAVAKMIGYTNADEADKRLRWRRQRQVETLQERNRELRRRLDYALEQKTIKRAAPTDGVVYFLRVGGYIKIGWTSDLDKRMRAYSPDSTLLAVMPGTRKDENRIHKRFSHLKTHGREWFPLAPQITEYVDQVVADHGAPPAVDFSARRKQRIVGPRLDQHIGARTSRGAHKRI